MTTYATQSHPRTTSRPRHLRTAGIMKKLLIAAAILIAVLLIAAWIFVPIIASSVAPGIIQDAANKSISGTVKVAKVSTSWSGPTTVTGIELRDDTGKLVGTFDATANLGVLAALGQLPTISAALTGNLTIERSIDAAGNSKTNLQRAIAPKLSAAPATTTTTKAPASPIAPIAANIAISNINITYTETDARSSRTTNASLSNLTGTLALDTTPASVTTPGQGPGTASVKLDGNFLASTTSSTSQQTQAANPSGSGKLSIAANLRSFLDTARLLNVTASSFDVTSTISNAPTPLIDALASQEGVLTEILGQSTSVNLAASGTLAAPSADIKLSSPNVTLDLAVVNSNGRIVATRPGSIKVQSLAFLDRIPASKQALASGGVVVNPANWPSATFTLQAFDLPAQTAGAGSGTAGWAGAALVGNIAVGQLQGTISGKNLGRKTDTPESLVLEPLSVAINIPKFETGGTITASTRATIANQSAGDLQINLDLGKLIDARGSFVLLDARIPENASARIKAKDIATPILAPLLAGTGIEPVADFGPTLDLDVLCAPVGDGQGAVSGAIPPTNISFELASSNIKGNANFRIDSAGGRVQDDKARLLINSAAPMLNRLAGSQDLSFSGIGTIDLRIPELGFPVLGGKPEFSLASGKLQLLASDLLITKLGQNNAPNTEVRAKTFQLSAELLPRQATPIQVLADLLVNGQTVDLTADARIDGLTNQTTYPNLLAIGTRRLSGQLEAKGLPSSLIETLLGGRTNPTAALLSDLLGNTILLQATLGGGEYGVPQPINIKLAGDAITADGGIQLLPDAMRIAGLTSDLRITPKVARQLLEMAGQNAQALQDLAVRDATQLAVQLQPVTIPLKPGTFEPDWAKGGENTIGLSVFIRPNLIIDNILVDGRRLSAGLGTFELSAGMPITSVPLLQKQMWMQSALNLNANADILGDSPQDLLGKMILRTVKRDNGGFAVSMSLLGINTQRVEQLINQVGKLSGAVGESMTLTIDGESSAPGAALRMNANIQSPRLELSKLQWSLGSENFTLEQPAKVRWTLDPVFVERLREPPLPGQAPRAQLAGPTLVEIDLKQLALALPKSDQAGNQISGLFVPSLARIETQVRISTLTLTNVGNPTSTSRELQASGISANISTSPPSSEANSGKPQGTIWFDAAIMSMKTADQTLNQVTSISGSIADLANQAGILQTKLARLDLTANTGRIPTGFVDSLAGTKGELIRLLGAEVSADIRARSLSQTAEGNISIDLRAPRASLALGGPVRDGVLDTAATNAKPLSASLQEFDYQAGGELLKIFPLFGRVSRIIDQGNTKPSSIISRDLRIPIDGNWKKLSGKIDFDLGRVDYTFSESIGQFLDSTLFAGGRGLEQRPIPPFTVNIEQGIASYDRIELPVRNHTFRSTGRIDMVNRQMDVYTFVPTLAAAPGVAANINKSLGDALGKLFPNIIEDLTALPIRTQGPLDNPSTGVDLEAIAKEAGNKLKPQNILEGVGGLIGGLLGDPKKDQPKDQPKNQPQPQPQPAPGPAGPKPPSKDKPKPTSPANPPANPQPIPRPIPR